VSTHCSTLLWLMHSLLSPSSLSSSPPSSLPLCFTTAFIISVSVMCWKPSSHASLCSHCSMLSSLIFFKLYTAHTMSRILDLLSYSLAKSCKSSSRSGSSFFHDQTSVTGFTEDCARDGLHIASNTTLFIFHNHIMLSSSSTKFWEGQSSSVISWTH
jgi:hypothetical protein